MFGPSANRFCIYNVSQGPWLGELLARLGQMTGIAPGFLKSTHLDDHNIAVRGCVDTYGVESTKTLAPNSQIGISFANLRGGRSKVASATGEVTQKEVPLRPQIGVENHPTTVQLLARVVLSPSADYRGVS